MLVLVSFFVAVLAGFAFVHLSHRLALPGSERARAAWMSVGALIMGFGIWGMHFIGMLAYQVPVPVAYDPLITALSVVPAVLASGLSLRIVARADVSDTRLMLGGLIFGGGIGMMHYTGMAAIDFDALVRYDLKLFTLSLLVAVLFAMAALWIAHGFSRRAGRVTFAREVTGALMIGFAVAGMHYTAMSSTLCFVVDDSEPNVLGIEPEMLASVTAVVAILVLVAGIGAVILDRRLAREIIARQDAAERAEDATERLQLVMDNVAEALVTLGADGTIQSVNRATEQIFARPARDLVGWPVSVLLASSEDGPEAEALARALGPDATGQEGGSHLQFVGHRADGRDVFLEAVFSRAEAAGETVIIGALRDLTERVESQRAIARARELAEMASRAKTEFISHMSHELRTPLNAIIGLAEALLQIEALRRDPNRVREYLGDIESAGKHLLSLVNEILDLTVIERGGRAMAAETFDAVAEIEKLIRPLGTTFGVRGTHITVTAPDQPVMVVADRQAFRQVMLNLANNAFVHGQDAVNVRIVVEDDNPGDCTRILVCDNGPGMPDDLLRAVGQPFPQVTNSYVQAPRGTDKRNTGLGLYIVCQLMTLNGGAFELESKLGKGTTAATFWPRGHPGDPPQRAVAG